MASLIIDKSSSYPIYRQVAAALRRQMESGDLSVGDKLPSEVDLARQLGVSPMTVRQAYGDLTSAGLVERSHGRGTFVLPRPAAAPTVTEGRVTTDILLLLASYSAQAYHARLVDAVARASDSAAWNLHIGCHRERGLDHRDNTLVAGLVRQRQVDAVLVAGTIPDRDLVQLAAWQVPAVFLDLECIGEDVHDLRFDDADFAGRAVRRLAAGGCRRIGLLPGPVATPGARLRRRGDRLLAAMPGACTAAGVAWHPRLARSCENDEGSCTMAVTELMALPEPPDALVLNGDAAARAARRVLTACGSSIPLACFADDPDGPSVVVAKPFAELARSALESLRRILSGDTAVPAHQIVPNPDSEP